MTVPIRVKKKCRVCKSVSEQSVLVSTSRFGVPDLDTRPPEMMRSSMIWWVQECPVCGYTASDISARTTVTKSFLKSERYVSCNGLNFKSGLGKMFFKAFLTYVHSRQWEKAFKAVLSAAWACDDDSDVANAVICRKYAIKCMGKLPTDDTLKIVKADLMRRAGLFSRVISEYEHFRCEDKTLNQVASFEVEKSREKDARCYTLDDVKKRFTDNSFN